MILLIVETDITIFAELSCVSALIEISTYALTRRGRFKGCVEGILRALAGATVVELTIDNKPGRGFVLAQKNTLPHENSVIIPNGFKLICN